MLEGMHGETTPADPPAPPPAAAPGARATATRLQAWCRLHRADPDGPGPVYLTDSPAVYEHMLERMPAIVPLVRLDLMAAAPPAGPGAVSSYIEDLRQIDTGRLRAGDLPPAPLPVHPHGGIHLALLPPSTDPICGPAVDARPADGVPVSGLRFLVLWDA